VRADTAAEALEAVRKKIAEGGGAHELAGEPEPAPPALVQSYGLAKGQAWFI
jgi:hypothetical protein